MSLQNQHNIGITLIGGFLGSGKTTLLQRAVRDPDIGSRVAVLVNDLGELGLDQALIQSEAHTPSLHIQQLTSGCICCTLQGDLPNALQELATASSPPPERILVETSGVSNTSEVSYAISALQTEYPFHTDAVVIVVDAYNAKRSYEEHPDLFADQLRSADVVLLNKQDLLPDPKAQQALQRWLTPLAPRATWLWTTKSNVNPSLLLGVGRLPSSWPSEENTAQISFVPGTAHDLTAVTIPLSLPLRWDKLEEMLSVLADSVFRTKGLVDLEIEGYRQRALIQSVGDWIDYEWIEPTNPLYQATPRMIFIGNRLDKELFAKELATCVCKTQTTGGRR